MILFYACLGLYTFSGPLKPTHTTILDPNCINHTWSALLYVNNIFDPLKEVSFDRVTCNSNSYRGLDSDFETLTSTVAV